MKTLHLSQTLDEGRCPIQEDARSPATAVNHLQEEIKDLRKLLNDKKSMSHGLQQPLPNNNNNNHIFQPRGQFQLHARTLISSLEEVIYYLFPAMAKASTTPVLAAINRDIHGSRDTSLRRC